MPSRSACWVNGSSNSSKPDVVTFMSSTPPTGSVYPPLYVEFFAAFFIAGGRVKSTAELTASAGAVAMCVSR